MKKVKIKNLVYCGVLFLVFISLMLIGSFYDLQISNAVVSLPDNSILSRNFFGVFFEIIGEMPFYLIVATAAALIFNNFNRRKECKYSLIVKIMMVLVSVGMIFYMNYKLFKYLSQHFNFDHLLGNATDYVAYFLLGVCLTAVIFYLTSKLSSTFLNKTIQWCIVILGTALLSQVLTHTVKGLAGRPRYRAMHMLHDFSLYKNWYEFSESKLTEDMVAMYGATSSWFKSFPSGHTSAASLVVVLTAIPSIFERLNNKKFKILFHVIPFAYIFCVAFSRIVVGAHFLTDVTVGGFLTIASYYIIAFLCEKVFTKVKIQPLNENRLPKIVEEEIS